jgi:hypothetical protein
MVLHNANVEGEVLEFIIENREHMTHYFINKNERT